jgi:hypothetical protein
VTTKSAPAPVPSIAALRAFQEATRAWSSSLNKHNMQRTYAGGGVFRPFDEKAKAYVLQNLAVARGLVQRAGVGTRVIATGVGAFDMFAEICNLKFGVDASRMAVDACEQAVGHYERLNARLQAGAAGTADLVADPLPDGLSRCDRRKAFLVAVYDQLDGSLRKHIQDYRNFAELIGVENEAEPDNDFETACS